MVPASELSVWRAHFAQEPWGFKAMDMLASKSAMQISAVVGRLKPGANYRDFMFRDRFETCDLTQEEFDLLSKEEQDMYNERQIRAAQMVLN
jgi:hypothetical protein